jgi:hypothetical protein
MPDLWRYCTPCSGARAHTPDCEHRDAMKFLFGRNSLSPESQVIEVTPELANPGLAGQRFTAR